MKLEVPQVAGEYGGVLGHIGVEDCAQEGWITAAVSLWQNLLNYRAHMHLSLSNDL